MLYKNIVTKVSLLLLLITILSTFIFAYGSDTYGSGTYGVVTCGDSFCDSSESCSSCSHDCGSCVSSGSSSSSGDGGGGGGGGSSQVASVVHQWSYINQGATFSMKINNEKISFTQLDTTLLNSVTNAEIKIEEVPTTSVEPPKGQVYQYVSAEKTNIQDSDISIIRIKFRVETDWFNKNNINKEEVVLKIYKNNLWSELPTVLISENIDGNKITGGAIITGRKTGILSSFLKFLKDLFSSFFNSITGFATAKSYIEYESESNSLGQFEISVKEITQGIKSENGVVVCSESWQCSTWGKCTDNKEIRECDDINFCATTNNKPSESRECVVNTPAKIKEQIVKSEQGSPNNSRNIWIIFTLGLLVLGGIGGYYGYRRFNNKKSSQEVIFTEAELDGVRKYIIKSMNSGVNETIIRNALLRVGWPERTVNNEFERVRFGNVRNSATPQAGDIRYSRLRKR